MAILDDDDSWTDPNKLKKQIEFLDKNGYYLVGTAVNLVDRAGRMIGQEDKPTSDGEIRKKITAQNMFVHSTAMFLRAAALEAGGYDPLNLAEDYSLWLKLGSKGKVANLSDWTTDYMTNNSTYKNTDWEIIKKVYRVAKTYLPLYPHRFRNSLKWLYRRIKAKIYG